MVALTHTRGRGKGNSLYGAVDQVGYEDRESERLKGNERESVRFTSKCLRPCASLSNCCASFFFCSNSSALCPAKAGPARLQRQETTDSFLQSWISRPTPTSMVRRARTPATHVRQENFPFFYFCSLCPSDDSLSARPVTHKAGRLRCTTRDTHASRRDASKKGKETNGPKVNRAMGLTSTESLGDEQRIFTQSKTTPRNGGQQIISAHFALSHKYGNPKRLCVCLHF